MNKAIFYQLKSKQTVYIRNGTGHQNQDRVGLSRISEIISDSFQAAYSMLLPVYQHHTVLL